MPGDRRHARVLAMQALCQWDVQRDESHEALLDFLAEQSDGGHAIVFATSLVDAYWRQHAEVDGYIAGAAEKWTLSRISTVERNAMRVAIVEMLGGDVPPRVAIDEAIEIGKEYGGADSPRFINGVLDKVLKSLPPSIRDQR